MRNKLVVALSTAAIMAVPVLGFAAMAASNTVNSAAIVDGSIATADIANLAVTSAKIANSAVTATQLASGAVTDAKISGQISVSKLPVGTSSTTVAAGNHTHSGAVKYAQVVVVAKSGGDSTNPATAVDSIKDASATKPYLIKVMPGVYDIGNAMLQMKPYVDVEGSGNETSVITSSNYNVDFNTCTVGTVNMANNSSIRDIKLVNTATDPSPRNENAISALIFNNVKASAENIHVLVGKNGAFGPRNNGICSSGANAHMSLNNIYVEIQNGSTGHSNALMLTADGSATLTNSKLKAFISAEGSSHVIDCVDGIVNNVGTLTVINSTVEGVAPATGGNNQVLWLNNCHATISNSVLKGDGGEITIVEDGDGLVNLNIFNSQLIASNPAGPFRSIAYGTDGIVKAKIANNLLYGGLSAIPNLDGVKLFNNYDENLEPVPNN
jgi:hypothetical protein